MLRALRRLFPLNVALSVTAVSAFVLTSGCSSSSDGPSPSIAEFSAFQDMGTAPDAVRTASAAVVRITMATLRGTGSFISADGLLLTNNHVLGADVCAREGCFAELDVDYQRQSTNWVSHRVFVEPQFIDVGLDVAVLQVFEIGADGMKGAKFTPPHSLQLNRKSTAELLGSTIYVVGHPNGRLKKWTKGDVVDTEGVWFESTAFSLPGSSGSPAVDVDGNVIGILHRGGGDDSLITASGVNDVSILSPSASIMDLLAREATPEARGLSLLRSIAADTTAEDVVKNSDVYLNAHASTATVAAFPASVLDLLGAACDAGLKVETIRSLEELATTHEACLAGAVRLYCPPRTAKADFAECPDAVGRDAWRARFQKVFDRYLAFNGAPSYGWITNYLGYLDDTQEAGVATGRTKLEAFLSASPQPVDLSLAAYLARYGVPNYGGVDVKSYVTGYAQVPAYALSAFSIVSGVLALSRRGNLDATSLRTTISNLLVDPKIALGARLFIEEVAFANKVVR
jgi:V8-like Glu-specific endopeptidase